MAEGARECWGLTEWDLARNTSLRPHLRYLAQFTPLQRQEMMTGTGLPFTKMSLAQQQHFIALALQYDDRPLESLEELAGATLRVAYTEPGWFQLGAPDVHHWSKWVVRDSPEKRTLRPMVRERTRAAALQAARRFDPQIDETQIHPTVLDLVVIYTPGLLNRRDIHEISPSTDVDLGSG
jgi:hypothetical protein